MKKIKDGNYKIDKDGNLLSLYRNKYKKPIRRDDGYVVFNISVNGRQKTAYLHRLLAEAFIPNPENKPQVNHKNGIKYDNRLSNLEWVTESENSKHAYDNGLMTAPILKGEDNASAKLDWDKVNQLRYIYENTSISQKKAGNIFNISESQSRRIVNYESWQ